MIVLALDTTLSPGSLAVRRDRDTTAVVLDAEASPSVQLPGRVDGILTAAGLTTRDVDVFAVSAGPGSLTGLRVGIATVQGLAFATSRPVVAVSTLETLAVQAVVDQPLRAPRLIVAWTFAHRGEVFAAVYLATDGEGERTDPLALGSVRRRLALVEGPAVADPAAHLDAWSALLETADVTFIGNAVPLTSDLLGRAWPRADRAGGAPLASTLALIAADRASRGLAVSPHAIRPLYVRRPDAVVARERAEAIRRGGEPVQSHPGE